MTFEARQKVIMLRIGLLVCSVLVCVNAHGRLRKPASRSTCWRDKTEGCIPNYTDHELFCGGFDHQHNKQDGKCGICGDPYDQPRPRENENGGMYGKGVVVEKYSEGQVVEIRVELTASHRGYFEFSLCEHNDPLKYAEPGCFKLLQLADGSGTRYTIVKDGYQNVYVEVRLPEGVTCSHCIIKWRYRSGNRWGCDEEGCDLGHGPQEEFYGCADVEIK